jgi:hypothetical protein
MWRDGFFTAQSTTLIRVDHVFDRGVARANGTQGYDRTFSVDPLNQPVDFPHAGERFLNLPKLFAQPRELARELPNRQMAWEGYRDRLAHRLPDFVGRWFALLWNDTGHCAVMCGITSVAVSWIVSWSLPSSAW